LTRPDQPDAVAACADLIDRGVPEGVAADLVMQLAGADRLTRLGITARIFSTLAGPSDNASALAEEAQRWLRKHGYLPQPLRCRWCGKELNAHSRVVVQVDGTACEKCSKSRGVS
jgi:hypothetical protein